MTATGAVLALDVDVRREEVTRYLGYPDRKPVAARAAERLAALWPAAVARLAPHGAFAVVARGQAADAGMPEPAHDVGVGVCTIGPALEAESQRLAAAGHVLDALVLDAIGSAAAEAAADALNLELCAVAAVRGLEAGPRVSPGYGEWPTACQAALLALLPIAALGITLTPGSMMVPRKSVSFAVNLDRPGAAPRHAASRCERCGLLRCRHRLAAPGPTSPGASTAP
ncbi:MAG TPA: hypothetical protein VLW17_01060 [Thermoanaerobaculaceae bacterium]|nr:hypothetical protein [Thermoanaerobaculaceae bacterium]